MYSVHTETIAPPEKCSLDQVTNVGSLTSGQVLEGQKRRIKQTSFALSIKECLDFVEI
jgi:hypothetical protein